MTELPVFRLEDFSDVIEVRFTEEMRQRLKPYFPTTPNRPYSKIAKRLFTVWSHSGNKGKVDRLHSPYVPVRWVKEIAKISETPYEELERSVVSARAGYGGNTEVNFPNGFPVKPTEDHAWLLGLFFSSGGIGNRKRGRTRYPFGRMLRFSVSDPIVQKLVEIGKRIGDLARIYDPNVRVRTEKIKRTGIGNRRRRTVKFHSVTVEMLVKLGLPKYSEAVKDEYGWDIRGKGRVYSLRNIGLKLPEWISENDRFMHAFVEGYVNGQKGASWAYSKPYKHYRVIECHMQVRVAGMNKSQTLGFLRKIAEYLQKLNITGKIRPMCYPNSRLTYWLAYEVFKDESLCKLSSEFNILKPDLRARLFLMKHKNLLLIRMLQNFDSLTTVIFGVLLEYPRSVEEISRLLRLRKSQVERVLEKLRKLQLIEEHNGIILINASIYKEKQLQHYRREREKLRSRLLEAQEQFFMQCGKCGKFVTHTETNEGRCVCGGKLHPVERLEPLSLMGRREIVLSRDHTRIAKSTIPEVVKC